LITILGWKSLLLDTKAFAPFTDLAEWVIRRLSPHLGDSTEEAPPGSSPSQLAKITPPRLDNLFSVNRRRYFLMKVVCELFGQFYLSEVFAYSCKDELLGDSD
jgi:hypothetical protein